MNKANKVLLLSVGRLVNGGDDSQDGCVVSKLY